MADILKVVVSLKVTSEYICKHFQSNLNSSLCVIQWQADGETLSNFCYRRDLFLIIEC